MCLMWMISRLLREGIGERHEVVMGLNRDSENERSYEGKRSSLSGSNLRR